MLSLNELNRIISPITPYFHDKDRVHWTFGNFIELCARDERKKNINIQSFLHWVKPAILNGQYHLFYSKDGSKCIGYIMWAWVNDETHVKYLKSKRFILHPSEWNEGRNLIIVDYCNMTRSHHLIKNLFKNNRKIKSNVRTISYCIRKEDGTPLKARQIYNENKII